MKKAFQPFSNLWLTTRTWFDRSVAWTDGAWEELDAEELETTFEEVLKTIARTKSQFQDKEGLESILAVASAVKEKVDEFKPVVPIAVALRKDGMMDRHWDAVSDALGSDIRPIEGFTLQSCITAGLLDHGELCEDVGEKAYKEFNIEKSLKKMKTDWEP
jgi:dynein heavy chain